MNALPNHVPLLSAAPGRAPLSLEELEMCVRALDPGSRALLDLSLRRRLPFEAMAGVLHTDPFDLARRRARAVARIAAELDLEGSGVIATVKAALARLPDHAWGVPAGGAEAPPAAVPLRAVQAEAMAESARALMEKLSEHRELVRQVALDAAAAREQPTVEMEIVVDAPPAEQPTVESEALPRPETWEPANPAPVAASPMAAAFSHHPAFAVEAAPEATSLPPLAVALARAAASERAATEPAAGEAPETSAQSPQQEEERTPAPEPVRPASPLTAPHAVQREPRRRLARGGLVIGLLLALLRLLAGRR